MTEYSFTKSPVDIDQLTVEIGASSIVTILSHINLLGNELSIFFEKDLSDAEQSTLGALIDAHTGDTLIEKQKYAKRLAKGGEILQALANYASGIPDHEAIALVTGLADVKTALELGMLDTAVSVLQAKPATPTLDAIRQKFVDIAQSENLDPTSQDLEGSLAVSGTGQIQIPLKFVPTAISCGFTDAPPSPSCDPAAETVNCAVVGSGLRISWVTKVTRYIEWTASKGK